MMFNCAEFEEAVVLVHSNVIKHEKKNKTVIASYTELSDDFAFNIRKR